MRKTIIITFLLVNLITPNYICAGESQSKVNIKFKSQLPRGNRIPAQNPVNEDSNIDAYVENCNLTIIFEESEGMATLKIEDLTDGSISTMQFHTSAPLILPIGDPSAPLVFTITTDAGNEYQAWL